MAGCTGVTIEGPIRLSDATSPAVRYVVQPPDYARTHNCRIIMKINGSRVTGLGPCGGEYVSGFAQNSAWVIQPPPVEPTKLEVDVICQDCFSVIYPELAQPPTPTKGPVERYLYLVVGLILGPPVIVAILGIGLIATPIWSVLWAVLDNGPMDKSPKDLWDMIWDLI